MKYDKYAYLFPPRPESKTTQSLLPFFENRGWGGQVKRNGTCSVIFTDGKDTIFKQRHATESPDGDDHKAWQPTDEHREFFAKTAKDGKWNVFCAELVHSKTQDIKNQFYVFDMIVRDGIQLIGSTQAQRQIILHNLWKPIDDEIDQVRVGDYVSVAKTFQGGLSAIFDRIVKESASRQENGLNVLNEGLVLKNPKATLGACFTETANRSWQTKCRIQHKNYSF